MISAPTPMPIAVPAGPAIGRKVDPGMTKAPQPTLHPKESAQTAKGERCLINRPADGYVKELSFIAVRSSVTAVTEGQYLRYKNCSQRKI